jgi:hypothetical protein
MPPQVPVVGFYTIYYIYIYIFYAPKLDDYKSQFYDTKY